ncbi:MAG TPA: SPFH domain-containing protein [Patescibacteria group bacterium]|nr:SPFH domain-containing protein [Patescibacteria group bacterium]
MSFVRAMPNQYLLAGRGGRLENRGSAVQVFLRPGTVWVLVPSTKQEATFEFTQETRDGIPLRFKGLVVYRITDPVAAARVFEFSRGAETAQINTLLTHICLGELRHAVSHMTMAECIEQRKTTLTGVIREALEATIHPADQADDWGLTLEVAQVAQVFIVDDELRQQLEAEVRNEVRLRSGQSDVRTAEEIQLAEMSSRDRVAEQKLESDREALRRSESLFEAEMVAQQARIEAETPVRLLRIEQDRAALEQELEMRSVENRVQAVKVQHDLQRTRAEQELRREILPLEQAPRIVEAASGILHGANLTLFGDEAGLMRQVAPVLEVVSRAVEQSLAGVAGGSGRRDAQD